MAKSKTYYSCTIMLLQLSLFFFALHHVAYASSQHNYLAINCGSNNHTSHYNNCWTTDINIIHSTTTVTAAAPLSLSTIPYTTARLSHSPFTYSFNLTAHGPKLLRLHFYPSSYPGGFLRHNALFTVRAGHRTLLNHFNASHHADKDNNKPTPQRTFSTEYRINVEPGHNLNITFTPSSVTHPHAYAFINGIEIISYTNNNIVVKPSNNPTPPPPPQPTPTKTSKNKNTTVLPIIAAASIILLSIIAFLIFRCLKNTASSKSDTNSSTEASNACRHFSIAEIRSATNIFDDALIIGNGGFGNVYKGQIDTCHTHVAIKRLKPGSDQGAREFQTEINMLSQLRHRHLVSLIGYCNDGEEMILVYDFMARGTLRDHLYNSSSEQHNPSLSWNQRLEICLAAARGLHFLHGGVNRPSVIHRDVKSTNILLDQDWVAKVSDFGLSKVNGANRSHVTTDVKGSLGYLDPDYYMSFWLTQKSDVYSFGVVLLEVLCGRPPIKRRVDKQEECLVEWVKKCFDEGDVDRTVDPSLRGTIRSKCLDKFIGVALSCLNDRGKQRPLMKDVVKGLETAMRLQHSGSRGGPLFREKRNNSGEEVEFGFTKVIKNVGHAELEDKYSGVSESSGSKATTTCSEDEQALVHGVFSDLGNPTAR